MTKTIKRATKAGAKKNYKTKPASRVAVTIQRGSFFGTFGKLMAAFTAFAKPAAPHRRKRARA